jgi:hypothetical protein
MKNLKEYLDDLITTQSLGAGTNPSNCLGTRKGFGKDAGFVGGDKKKKKKKKTFMQLQERPVPFKTNGKFIYTPQAGDGK